MIVIDLDGLKHINDTRGHAAGDELLLKASRIMRDTIRTNDVAARLGGDEFAVLGVECDETAASNLVERLRENLAAAGVRSSIGWAARKPEFGLRQACGEADERMYAEKKANHESGASSLSH